VEIKNNFIITKTYDPPTDVIQLFPRRADLAQPAQTADRVGEDAAKYDLRDISPVEIDGLAAQLMGSGRISDGDHLTMLTRGAEFLSHLPGDHYTPERLNAKSDIVAQTEWQLAEASKRGNPVEALTDLLDFFREFEARQAIPETGLIV
jgi:hypothetical protein